MRPAFLCILTLAASEDTWYILAVSSLFRHPGCPVPRLWQSLMKSQQTAESLNDPLKQAIWADMLEPGSPVSLGHTPKNIENG